MFYFIRNTSGRSRPHDPLAIAGFLVYTPCLNYRADRRQYQVKPVTIWQEYEGIICGEQACFEFVTSLCIEERTTAPFLKNLSR